MLVMEAFTGMMVVFGVIIMISEIIRDLYMDTIKKDWFWDYYPERRFNVPAEMFFFRDAEDMDFVVNVEDEIGQFIYFGHNAQDLQDLLEVSELLSDEGTKPLYIEVGPSVYLPEVDMEYKKASWNYRNDLTQAAIG